MRKIIIYSTLALCATIQTGLAQEAINPEIFPKASADETQYIFNLTPQDDETRFKVEIVLSKSMLADCNTIMLNADLESETLEGWGYDYYKVENLSPPASTMMACPNDPKTQKSIELNLDDDAFIRYNSKLPIVVYAPHDLTVGYRIWKTDGELYQ